MCSSDVFLAILAILFPPVAVWIKVGLCSADSIINIALCCLGYVPGLLHAWYIILKHPEPDDEYPVGYQPIVGPNASRSSRDPERTGVTYYYVSHAHVHGDGPNSQAPGHNQRGYGTTEPPRQQAPDISATTKPPAQPRSPQPQQQAYQTDTVPVDSAGEGSSHNPTGEARATPTYAEAVKGDFKVQTQE